MALQVITNDAASAGSWVPQVWAQTILASLRANVVMANLVNKDYSAALSQYGNSVNVPKPIVLTRKSLDQAGNAAQGAATVIKADTVPVKLDKWYGTGPIAISDLAQVQSRPDILANLLNAGGIALAEGIESDLLALGSQAAKSVGQAGTPLAPSTIAAARKALVDSKVPQLQEKYGIYSTGDYQSLLTSQNVTYALNYGGPDAIRAGNVPTLYGVKTFESQLVPVLAGPPVANENLVFARDFAALVTRPLELPIAGVMAAIVTDDETGLAFRMTLGYDQYNGRSIFSMDVLYGVAVLRPEFGVQVLS